jgi:hypothetical protein
MTTQQPTPISAETVPLQRLMLEGPLPEHLLLQLAEEIQEVRGNRCILAFLEEVWDRPEADTIRLWGLEQIGPTTVYAVEVYDAQGKLLLPNMQSHFWQQRLEQYNSLAVLSNKHEFDETRLKVINSFLRDQHILQDMRLPDPDSGYPAYGRQVKIASLPTRYPTLYQCIAGWLLASMKTEGKRPTRQFVTAPNNPNWKRGQAFADIPEVYTGEPVDLEVIAEGTGQHYHYRVRKATDEEVHHPNAGLMRWREEEIGPGAVHCSIERWLQAIQF